MFNSPFNKTFLSTLTAAVVATSFAINPAYAGGGGGGREDKVSTISTTNADGSTTSIRSKNGAKTYTKTRTNKGKVVNRKKVNKKPKAFITMHNADGTNTTVKKPSKGKVFATRHFPDGTEHTVFTPSNPRNAFITMHNADGTNTTAGDR